MMRILFIGCAAAALTGADAAYAQTVGELEWLANVRARYESVQQDGKLDAEALTVRTRLGVQTSIFDPRVTFLAELENTFSLVDGDRNTSLDPRPQFASINDPDFTELNRLQLGFAPNDDWAFTLGRQYLSFDGNRIIGSPGHRQDKTSHDALRVDYDRGAFEASYVYHWRLNRNPGDNFDWDTDAHLFHAGVQANPALKLTGFVYLIDITEPGRENLSNLTWGGRAAGAAELGAYRLSYDLLVASQSDYGEATVDSDQHLIDSGVSLSRAGARISLGYDIVSGDGSVAFANPFAANHGTAGWADVFHGGGRAARADGLEDFHIGVGYGRDFANGPFQSWEVGLVFRDFEAENTSDDLGQEWDAEFGLELSDSVSLAYQFADYDGTDAPSSPASRTKHWLVLTYSR